MSSFTSNFCLLRLRHTYLIKASAIFQSWHWAPGRLAQDPGPGLSESLSYLSGSPQLIWSPCNLVLGPINLNSSRSLPGQQWTAHSLYCSFFLYRQWEKGQGKTETEEAPGGFESMPADACVFPEVGGSQPLSYLWPPRPSLPQELCTNASLRGFPQVFLITICPGGGGGGGGVRTNMSFGDFFMSANWRQYLVRSHSNRDVGMSYSW